MTNTLSNTDNVPEWAVKEVCRRTGERHERFKAGTLSSGVARVIRVAAEILAECEDEPVDPVEAAIQRFVNERGCSSQTTYHEDIADAFRRGIELAREQGA